MGNTNSAPSHETEIWKLSFLSGHHVVTTIFLSESLSGIMYKKMESLIYTKNTSVSSFSEQIFTNDLLCARNWRIRTTLLLILMNIMGSFREDQIQTA